MEITQALHDLGRLTFVGTVPSIFVWLSSIEPAIHGDPRARPCYPRWLGYLNVWCVFLIPSGITIMFFTREPFSWHGIIAFHVPLIAFAVWYVLLIVHAQEEMTRQEEEDAASRFGVSETSRSR